MALGPVNVFTQSGVKLRWTDQYASDAINRAFTGVPRGIYLGFTPSISGLTLTLSPDVAIVYSGITGAFTQDTTVTGGSSGATAVIRVDRAPLPGRGILQLTGLTGTFEVGETITALGASATVDGFTSEGVSVAVLSTTSTLAGDRTEETLTVVTPSEQELDFSPVSVIDGVYHIMVTAGYEMGTETTAQIISRLLVPADNRFEINVCTVTKTSGTLVLSTYTPFNRFTPYADGPTRHGFSDPGSIEDLQAALLTVQEVAAARTGSDGVVSSAFSVQNSQTTGLPNRLNTDLRNDNMASRLGKQMIVVKGNVYDVPTASATLNVSGSFSAKTRDYQPYRDVSNNIVPTGVTVPVLISPSGTDGIILSVSGITGTFTAGEDISGAASGAKGVIRSVSGSLVEVNELLGSFFVGEAVSSVGPPTASGTITAIDQAEGAITAEDGGTGGDPTRNLVTVLDTLEGKRPTNASGNAVYGRLLFGPSGAAGTGGGDPGELLVATGSGEQINWTNGSTAVTGNNIDFTQYLLPGDIIEGDDGRLYEVSPASGSVQAGTFLLTTGKPYVGPNASSGLSVGSGPRRRLRFILQFVTRTGGVETATTIDTNMVPAGAQLAIFFPGWFNRALSRYSASLDLRAVGDPHRVQSPGSDVPGLGYHGLNSGLPLIGAIKSWQVAGVDPGSGNYHTVNYLTGTVTQTSTGVAAIFARGPQGPTGPAGVGSPGPQGPTGVGFNGIQNLSPINVSVIGSPGIGTDTFDVSPNKIRFYTITAGIREAGTYLDTGIINNIDPTPTFNSDSILTFEYRVDDAGSFQGTNITVFCAIATD
ncbi:MAG: hypothetical protein AB7L09_00365 [Nitrospira sp.]